MASQGAGEVRLSGNPLLREIALRAGSRLHRRRGVLALSAIAIAAVALLTWSSAASLYEPMRQLIELLSRFGFVMGALAAGHAVLLVSKHRRLVLDEYRTSWLSAAPISRGTINRVIVLRVAAKAVVHLAIILAVLSALHLLAGIPVSTSPLTPLVAAGFAAGGVIGWLLPHRVRNGWEASRYAPRLREHANEPGGARALAHWPIAQVFAWQRPENSRFVVVAVLFSVQGGSSIAGGLAVVAAWLLAIYLVSLLQAVITSGRAAARWLRTTPIPFATFAWSIGKRALLHQLIGVSIGAVLGVMLGGPAAMILYLSALWMTIVLCVPAVTLAASYRGEYAPFKLALSIAGLAAVETRAHGWAIPLALAMAALYVRRAMNFGRTTP